MNHFISIFLFIMLSGCTVRQPIANLELPVIVDAKFSVCTSADGASHFTYLENEKLIAKSDAEWVVELPSEFILQGLSPIGQPIFKISYDAGSKKFITNPKSAGDQVDISVNEEGFLLFNGEFVPLRVDELPCLLAHTFPKKWLRRVVAQNLHGKKYHLEVSEDERTVYISLDVQSEKPAVDCANLKWSRFVFFNYSLKLCTMNRYQSSLKYSDAFELKWKRLD